MTSGRRRFGPQFGAFVDGLIHAAGIALAIAVWALTAETGYQFGQDNHLVHLVELRRTLDEGFLRHDWFLNAGGEGVRHAYLQLLAPLARLVGPALAAFTLWCLQTGLVAVGAYRLGRALHGERGAAYLAAALALFVPDLTLGDHWLVRESLNPGPLAKALALLALALYFDRRRAGLAALVAATLIHVQVGIQAAGLVAVMWTARCVRAWRAGEATPTLRPAGLAAACVLGAAAAAILPLLGPGEGLESAERWVLVAQFRFPWHYLASCWFPPHYAGFAGLGVAGVLAMRLGGFRRRSLALAVLLGGVALALIAAAQAGWLDARWSAAWLELGAVFGLAALGEALAPGPGAAEPGPGDRAVELLALGGALIACVVAAWVFIEVIPLDLALGLRLLRTTVFWKAVALVVIAGPVARALVRGPVSEALPAACAVVALLTGRLVLVVAALAGLDVARRLGGRRGSLVSLLIAAAIATVLGRSGAIHEPPAILAGGLLAAAGLARLGAFAGPGRRRAVGGALALVALGSVAIAAPRLGLAGRLSLERRVPGGDLEQLALWARTETESDAVFLVPPHAASWRLVAERAVVVDLKAVPFGRAAMREWHERIADLAGRSGRSPSALVRDLALPRCRWPLGPLARAYAALDGAEVRRLAAKYSARYVVREGGAPLPFRIRHREGTAVLYDLTDPEPSPRP
jgi:Domain of unknown function (DUF6798)